jgi:beta-lactam-binding protein with PASTA domain
MDFFKRHLILTNFLLICLTAIALVALAMSLLNVWTAHGQVQVVPDVHQLTMSEASATLRNCGLHAEVVDSVYDNKVPRGSVVEQVPPPGDKVKPGRSVYLTINAFTAKKVALPELVGSSLRQAQATLQSLGFHNVKVVHVPSDYRDLVLAVKSMGVSVRAGTMVPVSASMVIEVGEGYHAYTSEPDSITSLDESEWEEIDDNAGSDDASTEQETEWME